MPDAPRLRPGYHVSEADVAAAAKASLHRHGYKTQEEAAAWLGISQSTLSAALNPPPAEGDRFKVRGHAIRRRILRDLDGIELEGPRWKVALVGADAGSTAPGDDLDTRPAP